MVLASRAAFKCCNLVFGQVPNPFRDETELLLGAVLQLKLHNHAEAVEQIVEAAVKERKMETTLTRMTEFWDALQFQIETYREDHQIMRLREQDFDTLENDQIAVQGMLLSRFVGHFESQVLQWKDFLSHLSEVLRLIHDILEVWMYLEPLFMHTQEVQKELPVDCKRFKKQDAIIKEVHQPQSAEQCTHWLLVAAVVTSVLIGNKIVDRSPNSASRPESLQSAQRTPSCMENCKKCPAKSISALID